MSHVEFLIGFIHVDITAVMFVYFLLKGRCKKGSAFCLKVVTKSVADVVPATNYSNLEAMFLGCHKRLDQIIQLLEKLVNQKEEVAQSSRPIIHDTPPSKPKAFMSQV